MIEKSFLRLYNAGFIAVSSHIVTVREPSTLSDVFKFYDTASCIEHLLIKNLSSDEFASIRIHRFPFER